MHDNLSIKENQSITNAYDIHGDMLLFPNNYQFECYRGLKIDVYFLVSVTVYFNRFIFVGDTF